VNNIFDCVVLPEKIYTKTEPCEMGLTEIESGLLDIRKIGTYSFNLFKQRQNAPLLTISHLPKNKKKKDDAKFMK